MSSVANSTSVIVKSDSNSETKGYIYVAIPSYFIGHIVLLQVKRKQRSGNEAIRTQLQPSKPKREITNITNSQNTKRKYGQPSEQLFPKRCPLSNSNRTKNNMNTRRVKPQRNSDTKNLQQKTTTKLPPWNDDNNDEPVPLWCSQRWILAYIGFLGFGVVYAIRVNISVAIVCMLKAANNTDAVVSGNVSEPLDLECGVLETAASSSERGELEWDQTTKSTILASFFYGYIVTQVPGGWLADRYGGKRVLGFTILTGSILTILMPVSARASVYAVYVIRVCLGLLTGVSFPAMHAMWGRWAPPLERSRLTTLCYSGTTLGNVVTFLSSGYLCAYGFDNGWGSIFYVTGGLGIIWAVFWFYLSADSPSKHPRITETEKQFITKKIEYNTEKRTESVPWLSIIKAPCVWACMTAHVCNNWTNYTLLTNIPTFMKEVLKFDIKSNGAVSSIPYLSMFVSVIFAGQSADFLRSRKLLSTVATRKLYQITSFIGAAACLIGTGFCSCEQRVLAVALLTLAVTFTGFGRAGYVVNHVDFAPRYAGVLYGITNTFATVPGMVAPIVAGWLTPNNTQEEWRNVFYVCAAFDVLGIIVFGLFASGEMQPWARDSKYDVEIIVDSDPEIVPSTELNKTALNGLQVDKTALNGLNDQHVFGSKQSPVQENGADIANLSDQLNNG